MLKQVLISKDNLDFATRLQNEIFSNSLDNAYQNYLDSVLNITNNKYYLIYDNLTCIGISGLYYYEIDPTSAWLGWFGVKPEYRRCGYGSRILKLFEKTAKKLGFKYTRLYTDQFNNEAAISFYKTNGYLFEEYKNDNDGASNKIKVYIASKSLGKYPIKLWNNKNINLTEQLKKQLVKK